MGNRLSGSDFRERIFSERAEDGFYRTGEEKPWEHTLYGRPAQFWEAIEVRGLNRPPEFQTFMAFSDFAEAGKMVYHQGNSNIRRTIKMHLGN